MGAASGDFEADAYKCGYETAVEDAAQKCRYMLKHQNFGQDMSEYEKGFEVACELCEEAVKKLRANEGKE